MEDEARNFIKIWLTAIASFCYCYLFSSSLPKGKLRFLSLLPVFSLFTFLPFTLSAALPTGVTAFFFTWLANFKLLLFSFGTGPLSVSVAQHSFCKFVAFACLPIKLRSKESTSCTEAKTTPLFRLNWAAKLILLALLIAAHDRKDLIPPKTLPALYSLMLYLFIDVIIGFCIHWVQILVGIDLESPSNEPYMATSLQDFWGRRWNLVVTNTLRHTIYQPLRRAVEPTIGVKRAPLLAVVATFLVSGLMHELLFYQIMRVTPSWEVTWFFLFHGICVAAEVGTKAVVGDRWRLHRFVSGIATVAFVLFTATLWFYPPLVRNGAEVRVVEECKTFARLLLKFKL